MKVLNEKYLLKHAMEKLLPDEIVKRHKQPYRAPNISAFFAGTPPLYVRQLLDKDRIKKYGYFDPEKVDRLVDKVERGRTIGNNDNMALVGILSTQSWHSQFVENYTRNFLSASNQPIGGGMRKIEGA